MLELGILELYFSASARPATTNKKRRHAFSFTMRLSMKCLVLACDYDGTLAHDGVLDQATAAALGRLRDSGRRLLMVTGRELPDLQSVCKVLDRF
jgi:hypothetical protein